MDADAGMRENVQRDMSSEDADSVRRKSARWLSDTELQVYADEYGRNGFQGGLNWYKIQTQPSFLSDYELYSGRKIEIPLAFVAGKKDWGTYQEPGAVEALESGRAVRKELYRGTHLIEGAGHWVTQERPEECIGIIAGLAREALGKGESGQGGIVQRVTDTVKSVANAIPRSAGLDEPDVGGSKI